MIPHGVGARKPIRGLKKRGRVHCGERNKVMQTVKTMLTSKQRDKEVSIYAKSKVDDARIGTDR